MKSDLVFERLLRAVLFAVPFFFTFLTTAQEDEVFQEFTAEIAGEYRYFYDDPLFNGQHTGYTSFSVKPEYYREWADGKQNLKAILFFRWDHRDNKRTHFDVRELYWQNVQDNWEISVGLKKIYWGVTESAHLVDVINQTDVVESFDGEQKLGQPMVHYSYLANFGTFDVFLLPYFRKRVFPGVDGRFRFDPPLNGNDIPFESDSEEYNPDVAFRWSHYFGPFDVGVSHFYGNSREPALADLISFNILYPLTHQTGIDIQATTGPVLWKYESIVRRNDIQDAFALVAGMEYTFGNVFNSGLDIGIISEYLFDDRDELAFSGLDNDLFFGARFALNDVKSTELLAGTIFDVDKETTLISAEGSRRFGDSWKFELEARMFQKVDDQETVFAFVRQDSFLRFSLTKFL